MTDEVKIQNIYYNKNELKSNNVKLKLPNIKNH